MFPDWFYWIVLIICPIGLVVDIAATNKAAAEGKWGYAAFNMMFAVLSVMAFCVAYKELGFHHGT